MTWPGWISPCSGHIWPQSVVTMADLCLTCGHERDIHQGANATEWCDIPGCSCTKFEPADPKIEQTQGGDAHDHALDLPGQQRGSGAAGADVTGPAGATETPPAGGPDHWKQSEAELPPTTPAGPPDLQQAIHAATVALRNHDPVIGLSDPWAQPARIAVEAAYPLLLHATRDRHDALEVYAAELRGLLERSISGPADCWQCDMPGGYHLVDCPVAA